MSATPSPFTPPGEGIERRRLLGAFYSPALVAQLLTRWALQDRPGSVFDPSFGGCQFLREALGVLREAGSAEPEALVFGTDIDEQARIHADDLQALGVPRSNLGIVDFFEVDPSRFDLGPFDAVVGNPPYVRHHWYQGEARTRAREAARRAGFALNARAGLWAYFVAHAVSFVRDGGRMAFLLPGSVLEADYAGNLVDGLVRLFADVRLVRVGERVFPKAKTSTVVLLAADRGRGPGQVARTAVDTVAGLEAMLTAGSESEPRHARRFRVGAPDGLPPDAAALVAHLASDPHIVSLGDLAVVQLGVVTGANRFFVRTAGEAGRLEGPGVRLVPVLTRSRWLRHPRWTSSDLAGWDAAGRRTRLLVIERSESPAGHLRDLIVAAEGEKVDLRFKCRKRRPWYSLSDSAVPHAFLRYMGTDPPSVVLNETLATCTNSVHRLWWRSTDISPGTAAMGTWTSLFALDAELVGRSYGGGVLKLEPGKAVACRLPLVANAAGAVAELDKVARTLGPRAARQLADRLVLQEGLGLGGEDVLRLSQAVATLAARRARPEARNAGE